MECEGREAQAETTLQASTYRRMRIGMRMRMEIMMIKQKPPSKQAHVKMRMMVMRMVIMEMMI